MEKMKIVLCDANKTERDGYAAICRGICEKLDVSADIKLYSNSDDVMFDMGDISFSALVSIFIVDPENGFETVPAAIRDNGYDGLILYLSHSSSSVHFRQAFDVNAYHFSQKGTDTQILAKFHEVFEKSLDAAKLRDRKFFVASYAGEYKKIEVDNIFYFETLPNYSVNHMVKVVHKGGSFSFIASLQELEERFRENGFVRVHQSYLVSVDSIHRIDIGELTLNNSSRIPISRRSLPTLKLAMSR